MVSTTYRETLLHDLGQDNKQSYLISFVVRPLPLRKEASACRASSSLSSTLTAHCNTGTTVMQVAWQHLHDKCTVYA